MSSPRSFGFPVLVVAILLLPVAMAMADGRTVQVPAPNGIDDTAHIQAALDACVTQGHGCTVELQAGRYLTRQLVEFNFDGRFKGMGKDVTTIEALPKLLVNIPDPVSAGECTPNTSTCLWPSLIIFVDGNIEVSDLSIKETAAPGTATAGWVIFGITLTDLLDTLRFMGHTTTNVAIDRIGVEGLPDNSATSFGFNVINGVIYTGELPRSSKPFDYYFLSGTVVVRNSSFKSMYDGFSVDGFRKDNFVTVGGAPSAGNAFQNMNVGLDLEASEASSFEISYNRASGALDSMWVIPWQPAFVPAEPSHYFIHDNIFTTTAPNAGGVYLFNDPTNPWIRASVYDNEIESPYPFLDAIGAYNSKGAAISGNTITGTGGDAIGLWGTTDSTVIGNDVAGFAADPSLGLAQIYLDPGTSNDLVVCGSSTDTVLNQGAQNTIICGSSGATSRTARSPLLRLKPGIRR